MGMYAKLMSRITESSLMEEAVPVRYVFMMMLAMADPQGYVIGTDVAIARRMNISVKELQDALVPLMSPDESSNSKEQEGRRLILSDCERGYYCVNYCKYRDTRNEEDRREYMKAYMRKYRSESNVADVNSGKLGKPQLAQVAVSEKESEKEQYSEKGGRFAEWFKTLLPKGSNLPSGFKEKWAKCYDAMIRLDKRTDEQIMAVCKWARSDSFWSSNFQSPLKLRTRNPDDVQYFDVFMGKMNPPTQLQKPPKSRGQCIGEAGQRYALLENYHDWPKRPDGSNQTPDEVGDADYRKQLPAL